MILKSILMRPDIDVVYSNITIDEIGQIVGHENDEKYFREHYWVLEQLEAKYIDPLSKKLINEKPHKVALTYLKSARASHRTPYPHFTATMDELSRKLSGLAIDRSLDDIGQDMIKGVADIANNTIEQINSLDENEYDEPMKSYIKLMKKNILKLLKNSLPTSNPFTNTVNTPLGTKPFREHERTKKIMNPIPSSSELVMELKNLLKEENSMSNLNSFVNHSVENKIFYAYTLLNWLGYYADDFTKVKKNRDGFNASQNDMRHASYAHMATFLISNDRKFREKTIISYEFANVKTIVCSPEIFLTEHLFIK